MNSIDDVKNLAKYCLNCKDKPCSKACPLNNDIPSFIASIKSSNFNEAYNILSKTTALPSICSRVCPHTKSCEGNCIRGIKGIPVQISRLEAFIGDLAISNKYSIIKDTSNKSKKSIAVIGGGPAGLTCAAFLAKKNYSVTIYEKENYLGGLLVHGIPDFRLNNTIVKESIKKVLDLGVNIELNKCLGKDFDLQFLSKSFNAIFLSFGANIPSYMNIEGETLYNGVFGANSLLQNKLHPNYTNKKVAVIGGGNVAMDVARTINRLGAAKVSIIYRRSESQMPAEKKEIASAIQEGIDFIYLTNVLKINGDIYHNVNSIECIKTSLAKAKGGSRDIPINIENSNFIIDTDYVIMAIGSTPDKDIIDNIKLETNSKGYIKIDNNYMTSMQGVFAGGDLSGTKSTVASAAYTGRESAYKIDEYLKKGLK